MAVYKVAQDVEADDKLIGPFSFRQFIYLIIVALAGALAWGLSRVFTPLFIIPLPVIIFFGALALPLRKDQPMEIYLAALLSFYLKPRKRLWIPDGIESLIQITVPKVVEVQRVKDLSQTEAEKRLSYLADIADTGGWAIRHTADPFMNTAMNNDVWFAAQQTEDVLDSTGGVAQALDNKIAAADERRRQEMVARMRQPAPVAAPVTVTPIVAPTPVAPIADPYASLPSQPQTASPVLPTTETPEPTLHPQFNPYPASIHQSVIQPLDTADRLVQQAPVAPASPPFQSQPTSTSEKEVSPDIINLANNSDLSIETIQREADRIHKKSEEKDDGEVFVSLH
ncbi:MAG: PrgI family protein [Candidatus Saccharimonas sp.]|nr:PrgI family protein [Candidatus Saccharimonas sp.]